MSTARAVAAAAAAALGLFACDEPLGPQPDQPIRPPAGYAGPPAEPKGPPVPPVVKSAPVTAEPEAPKVDVPAMPSCPDPLASGLTAKAKWKDVKKHRLDVTVARKGSEPVTPARVTRADGAKLEDADREGEALVVHLMVDTLKGRQASPVLTVQASCDVQDKSVLVSIDTKTLATTLAMAPPPLTPGQLNVLAEPGLKVSFSGKDLGVTPLKNYALPPGKYAVKVAGPKNKSKTFPVEVKAGEATTLNVDKKQLK